MQEVFDKIIEKLESEYENLKEMYKRTKDMSFYFTFQGVNKAIEIVKQEAEKYQSSECGFISKSEVLRFIEEIKCNDDIPKNYGTLLDIMIWIRNMPTVDNNGWIPVEEELPETDKYILLSFSNFSIPCVGRYEEDENGGAFYVGDDDETCASQDMFVNAWMNLPAPYKPKGE